MQQEHIKITVDLGIGAGAATVWTCDLTKDMSPSMGIIAVRAFSSEVGVGSRKENASKQGNLESSGEADEASRNPDKTRKLVPTAFEAGERGGAGRFGFAIAWRR